MKLLSDFTPKQRISIWIIIALFTAIYCSISVVNHYLFRTNAYDLGIYNNMLYTYSQFKLNYTTIQQPIVWHAFSDHFEPIFFLITPLYYVFGSYTLLYVQIALIIAGGLGMMLWAKQVSENNNIAIALLLQFLSMWGVYSALAFDFHNNVTAAMLVPWLALFIQQVQWKKVLLIWILMLACKENMALYTAFVCAGFALHYFKEANKRNTLVLLSGASFIYFLIVIKFIIPHFQTPGAGYIYSDMYKSLGNTPKEMIDNVLNRPGYLFAQLFENFIYNPAYNGLKAETHFAVLISGGIFLIYRPQFLVMLIPIYLQKMFSNDPTKWGINYQYSIEFVPVICLATVSFLKHTTIPLFRQKLPWVIAAVTFVFTMSKLDSRVSIWYDKEASRFYQGSHYAQDFNTDALRTQLKQLTFTSADKISAQSNLVPHLANRTHIYLYPYLGETEYIVLSPPTKPYPLNEEQFQFALDTLTTSVFWKPIYNTTELKVFQRKN